MAANINSFLVNSFTFFADMGWWWWWLLAQSQEYRQTDS